MEITYTVDYDKHRRTINYYLKNSKIGMKTVEWTTLFKLWTICFILVIPLMSFSKHYGFCLGAFVYFFCVLLFLIFSKPIIIRLLLWNARKELEETDNSQVAIGLNEDAISFKSKDGLGQYNWASINGIEKGDQYVLFDIKPPYKLVPRYAFQSNESFEDFYRQSQDCMQAHQSGEAQKQAPGARGLYFLPVFMGLIILGIAGSSSSMKPEYVADAEGYWQDVFRYEMPGTKYTFDTTDDFQKMISEEQWEKHIQTVKEKCGNIISMHPIAHVDLEAEPGRAIVLHRVFGEKKSYYIRTYLVEGSIEWEINGYDIITPVTVDLEEQMFSLESDRKLLKEKLPYKIQITDNSVLESSGYQAD